MNQEAGRHVGEAGTGTASVTDGAQEREFGLNVVCLTLQKQELETER